MKPRERVLAAVEHRPVDRVPIDFGGRRSSGIMAIAYDRLKRHLGIASGDVYVYDVIQQLAIVEPPVLDLRHPEGPPSARSRRIRNRDDIGDCGPLVAWPRRGSSE